jgi:hypothetical protein
MIRHTIPARHARRSDPMPARRATFLLALLLSFATAPARAAGEEDWAAIFRGVPKSAAPGLPGTLTVFGTDAFPLATAPLNGGLEGVVIAGARFGRGRIVALGHDGYFGTDGLKDPGNTAFLKNAIAWCAGPGKQPTVGVTGLKALESFLAREGYRVVPISDNPADLQGCHVVMVTHSQLSENRVSRLREYIRQGGGVLVASTGWGWAQITGKPIAEHPGTRLTEQAGIAWTDLAIAASGRNLEHGTPPSRLQHASTALAALNRGPLNAAEVRQAVETCRTALAALPAGDHPLRREVQALAAGAPVPTAARPVRDTASREFAALALTTVAARTAPPAEVKAHPAASEFPGTAAPGAKSVRRTLAVDGGRPGWVSTGLYAQPGALIRVTLPEQHSAKPWKVRIGAHTDALWHLNSWRRAPQIDREFPLRPGVTEAANAFGGPVYLVVPDGSARETVQVTVEGAIEAPYFELGKTSSQLWMRAMRQRPAPWAELVGRRVALTVPSSAIRNLDDPGAVMEFWDRVVETQEELIGQPPRPRLERIVADAQVGYGYMHAGYPIVVPTDETMTRALSPEQMRQKGNWGYFHELGHNLQSPDWTFEGTGEVTNNVLVLYAYEKVLGKGFDALGEHASLSPQRRAEEARKFVEAGSPFERWKKDPFLALLTYMELKERFGWQAFQAVFRQYRDLPRAERPRNDQEKRDQFMLRFSRTVNTRLDTFFKDRWGIPLSAAAVAEAARLSAAGSME